MHKLFDFPFKSDYDEIDKFYVDLDKLNEVMYIVRSICEDLDAVKLRNFLEESKKVYFNDHVSQKYVFLLEKLVSYLSIVETIVEKELLVCIFKEYIHMKELFDERVIIFLLNNMHISELSLVIVNLLLDLNKRYNNILSEQDKCYTIKVLVQLITTTYDKDLMNVCFSLLNLLLLSFFSLSTDIILVLTDLRELKEAISNPHIFDIISIVMMNYHVDYCFSTRFIKRLIDLISRSHDSFLVNSIMNFALSASLRFTDIFLESDFKRSFIDVICSKLKESSFYFSNVVDILTILVKNNDISCIDIINDIFVSISDRLTKLDSHSKEKFFVFYAELINHNFYNNIIPHVIIDIFVYQYDIFSHENRYYMMLIMDKHTEEICNIVGKQLLLDISNSFASECPITHHDFALKLREKIQSL